MSKTFHVVIAATFLALLAPQPMRAADAPASAPASRPAARVFVSGTVTLPNGDAPTSKFDIFLTPGEPTNPPKKIVELVTTEDWGGFSVAKSIPAGTYTFSVYMDHQTVVSQTVEVPEKSSFGVKLAIASGGMEGTVIDAGGKPAPNVMVGMTSKSPVRAYHTQTDAAGHYSLQYILPGRYLVVAVTERLPDATSYQFAGEKDVAVETEVVKKDFTLREKKLR